MTVLGATKVSPDRGGRARRVAVIRLLLAAVMYQPSVRAAAGSGTGEDLTSLSLEQLLDVSVVGAPKYSQTQGEVAAAVSVITRQEIQAFGWRTLAEALASLPGLYSTYNLQATSIGARGFGLPGDFNTRLLVMIDGIRVNDPTYDAGRFGWDFPLDLDLIERIEFIPGPGGAVYGQNAMLGVVNVITRSGCARGGPGGARRSPTAPISWCRSPGLSRAARIGSSILGRCPCPVLQRGWTARTTNRSWPTPAAAPGRWRRSTAGARSRIRRHRSSRRPWCLASPRR
jgi:hypothetical protein